MKPLQGLAWLLVLQLAGEALSRALSLPVPGPVVGMMLLWPALSFTPVREQVTQTARFLLAHLSLLFVPVGVGVILVAATPQPNILISGDGRHVAVVEAGERLLVLRASHSDYTRDNLSELSGISGDPVAFEDWPGARCSRDFCMVSLAHGVQNYRLLAARNTMRVDRIALTKACARADIVVAERRLPRDCHPRWIKADREHLKHSGGLAINLDHRQVTSVVQSQGHHGWWRGT